MHPFITNSHLLEFDLPCETMMDAAAAMHIIVGGGGNNGESNELLVIYLDAI